jgi:hypothetical protein
VGSQLASYPTERLTDSLAEPRADVIQQVASCGRPFLGGSKLSQSAW